MLRERGVENRRKDIARKGRKNLFFDPSNCIFLSGGSCSIDTSSRRASFLSRVNRVMNVDLFPIPTTIYIRGIYFSARRGKRNGAGCWARDHAGAHVSSRVRVGWGGRRGAAQINLTVGRSSSSWSPFSGSRIPPGSGEYMQKGETEWKNYPSGLFSLDTRDKRFPPYCYFCVIPPRVSAVSTFNQLSSCYLRSTERRFTSRTFLFKLRYQGLQG